MTGSDEKHGRDVIFQTAADLRVFLVLWVPVEKTYVGPVEDSGGAERTAAVRTGRIRRRLTRRHHLRRCCLKPSSGIVQRI